MDASTTPKQSILGLVRTLKNNAQRWLREEIELGKVELLEKITWFGRNSAALVAAGAVAYAGLIIFLMGLGWLVAWALQEAGIQPVLAGFLGLAIVGLLISTVGAAFIFKGLKAFSHQSLAPHRTIHTIQRIKGAESRASSHETKPAPKRSSEELRTSVEATENRLSNTLVELGQRLSPRQINAKVKQRIQQRPYRSGVVAMAAGVLSGLFFTRASRRS